MLRAFSNLSLNKILHSFIHSKIKCYKLKITSLISIHFIVMQFKYFRSTHDAKISPYFVLNVNFSSNYSNV